MFVALVAYLVSSSCSVAAFTFQRELKSVAYKRVGTPWSTCQSYKIRGTFAEALYAQQADVGGIDLCTDIDFSHCTHSDVPFDTCVNLAESASELNNAISAVRTNEFTYCLGQFVTNHSTLRDSRLLGESQFALDFSIRVRASDSL